ncbi:tandem-95 repeat protein [Bremerella cremea]|uniref:EF-hand domain-containing protein n=1 Tax=Blastopirellula marina TaxID=124 RepID=A0A2S8FRH5_9BACT|nr:MULTISPECIES: Ig-like domain-containing protein [Pirellulaceae]PQO34778.1 hypothetical protein C5Y83_14860 [Blastopirellula marina]RCS47277.1 tandem-95 repeat protein [Bremerella cremea]
MRQPKRVSRRNRYARRQHKARTLRFDTLEQRAMLAANFIVNTTLDTIDVNPGDGIAEDASGNTSLRAAIMEANATIGNDTITLPAGTYRLTRSGAADDTAQRGDLDITDDITINGAGSGLTVIDAGGDSGIGERIFEIHRGQFELDRDVEFHGITFRGGRTLGTTFPLTRGGAMRIDFYNDVLITDAIFVDNQAPATSGTSSYGVGGAISTSGALEIRDSRFENNYASNSGGAIYAAGTVSNSPDRVRLDIFNSTLTQNRSVSGGAIENFVPLTIEASTLDNNTAVSQNGGSGQGGAINLQGGSYASLALTNSTLSGNRAIFGGGINSYLTANSFDITSSTIVYNDGAGIRVSSSNAPSITNSIIAGNFGSNSGTDVVGTVSSLGFNLVGDSSGSTGFNAVGDLVGSSTTPIDPNLGVLADNGGLTFTHALLAGSPAIDTGNINRSTSIDQRGIFRPQGAESDIGAFELEVSVTDGVVANDLSLTIDEDAFYNGTLPVTAPDGATLTYRVVQAPLHGNAVTRTNGTFFYAPTLNYFGSDSFIYEVSDGQGNSDTGTISFTIAPVNDPPYVDNTLVVTTDEDQAVTAEIGYLEVEGETVAFSQVSGPANGSLVFDSNVPGKFNYTPDPNFNGTDTFVFRATDIQGNFTEASVTIEVTPVNDAPIAVGDQFAINVGESLSISALPVFQLSMDSAPGDFVGAGKSWYYDDSNTSFSGTRNFDSGVSISLQGDTFWNLDFAAAMDALLTPGYYTDATRWPFQSSSEPGLDVSGDGRGNNLLAGEFTIYDVDYGQATSTSNPITSFAARFTQQGIEDGIIMPPLTGTILYNTAIGTGAGVLANDSDIDGDLFTAMLVDGPSHGTLTLNPDGTLSYFPDAGFIGTDSFTYKTNDGRLDSNVATVEITVSEVNDPPIAVDDRATTTVNNAVVINVLDNDTDANGDPLQVSQTTQPSNGTVSVNRDGSVTYSPATGFSGNDSFSYTINDGKGGSDIATVSVVVEAVNTPPVAQDDAYATSEDVPLVVSVSSGTGTLDQVNDRDTGRHQFNAASLDLQQQIVAGQSGYLKSVDVYIGQFSDVGNTLDFYVNVGSALQTDTPDFRMQHTLQASDIDGWLTIDVAAANIYLQAGEVFTIGAFSLAPADVFLLATNSDLVNGDNYTAGSLWVDGQLRQTPGNNDYDLLFRTRMGTVSSAGGVLLNDQDADGDPLTASLLTQASHGTVDFASDGTFTYTPESNFNGQDSFTYSISDGNGGSDTATVVLTVTPVNDYPTASDDGATTDEDNSVLINVLANDTDIEGDSLTIVRTTTPLHGSVFVNPNQEIVYTPNSNFNGVDTFTYAVDDGKGGVSSASVSVTVNSVNDSPIAIDDAQTTDEDTAVVIDVLANDSDVDGDPLAVSGMSSPAHGVVVLNGNGTITYTPDANYHGADSFTYDVSDGNGGVDTATVTITVNSVNDKPVANADTGTTDEDVPAVFDLLSNDSDIDGDPLTISSVTNPNHGTVVVNNDGTITYTPNANFFGTDSFLYTINDGQGGTDTGTVAITVDSVNDAPDANSDSFLTNEDVAVIFDVLINDTDVEGDSLSVTGVAAPSHGSAVLNVDGTVTYTPDPNFNGVDSFTYTISDGLGGADTATVSVTVSPVNDNPVATNDVSTTVEDAAVVISVLANDFDVDGDPLSVESVGNASSGTVVINPDNTITYTPDPNFNGVDSFRYTIIDGAGGSATATVDLRINNASDRPVAVDDVASTDEDTPIVIDVLANDSDIDGDTLLLVSASNPLHGSVVINADNTITYSPSADYHGADSFTYSISDGNGGTDTATVSITVVPVNDKPVAVDDEVSTAEDVPVVIALLSNDSEVDGDSLGIVSTTNPLHGNVVVHADNTVTYSPSANYNGTDSFTYTISDGNGGTDTATVSITVTQVNDEPVAVDDETSTAEDTPIVIDVLSNDNDVDGDSLTITSVSSPASGSVLINVDSTITYTPNLNFHGSDSFTYSIADGNGGTDMATVTVGVSPANDEPVALGDVVVTNEDSLVVIDVLSNDSDIDSDLLSVSSVSSPSNGVAVLNGDGTVSYTPNPNFNGTDAFTYTIIDGHGGTDTATVNVTVLPLNDAPIAVDDVVVLAEDTFAAIDVLNNDGDVEGDVLTVIAVTNPANGTATIETNGSIAYTPNANFNGVDSFEYTIADGNGGFDTATVNVTVTPVNDAPIAEDDLATTAEDSSVVIAVLDNDTDFDSDPLVVDSLTSPANGSVVLNGDGTITYTPAANYFGIDSFEYSLVGGVGTATVTITVTSVNDEPVAKDDAISTTEDTAVVIDVLANDSDIDSNSLQVTQVGAPANGLVSTNIDGTLTYTPNADFHGSDSFTYSISDGDGKNATATVFVTINSVNDDPIANDDTVSTEQRVPVVIPVLANDSDVDEDALSVSILGNPANGVAQANPDGTITYTPNATFVGSDLFTYTVSDGNGAADTATVTIRVSEAGGTNGSTVSVTLDRDHPSRGRGNGSKLPGSNGNGPSGDNGPTNDEIPVFHEWQVVAGHVWLTIQDELPDVPVDLNVQLTSSTSLFEAPTISEYEGSSATVEHASGGGVRVTTFTLVDVDLSEYQPGDRVLLGTLSFNPNRSNPEGLSADTSGHYAELETDLGFFVEDAAVVGGDHFTVDSDVIGQMAPVIYDHDEDGRIGLSDLAEFLSHIGKKAKASNPEVYRFDYNRNGRVSFDDLSLLLRHFGIAKPSSANIRMPGLSDTPVIQDNGGGLLEGESLIVSQTSPLQTTASFQQSTISFLEVSDSSSVEDSRTYPNFLPALGQTITSHENQLDQTLESLTDLEVDSTKTITDESLDPRLVDSVVADIDLIDVAFSQDDDASEDFWDEALTEIDDTFPLKRSDN